MGSMREGPSVKEGMFEAGSLPQVGRKINREADYGFLGRTSNPGEEVFPHRRKRGPVVAVTGTVLRDRRPEDGGMTQLARVAEVVHEDVVHKGRWATCTDVAQEVSCRE
jgi:hypothetical protein